MVPAQRSHLWQPVASRAPGDWLVRVRQISTEGAADAFSIAWYLVRGRALGHFWQGLGRGLGPLFPLVLVALLFGVACGLRSSGFRRGLSVL